MTRVIAVLFLLACSVGAVLVLGTGMPEAVPVPASALKPEVLQLPTGRERISNDLVFRPLFWQERRPVDAPQQAIVFEPAQSGALEDVVLMGVYSTGTVAGAVLSVRGTHQRLNLGDRLEGWELVAVTADDVQFARAGGNDGQQTRLVLERSTHE